MHYFSLCGIAVHEDTTLQNFLWQLYWFTFLISMSPFEPVHLWLVWSEWPFTTCKWWSIIKQTAVCYVVVMEWYWLSSFGKGTAPGDWKPYKTTEEDRLDILISLDPSFAFSPLTRSQSLFSYWYLAILVSRTQLSVRNNRPPNALCVFVLYSSK